MSSASGINAATPSAPATRERARLEAAMKQLEGVFVEQMLKAMRQTVPDEAREGGAGEEMFTGMLDGKLAELVPGKWKDDGLETAMMRQFSAALPPVETPANESSTGVSRR